MIVGDPESERQEPGRRHAARRQSREQFPQARAHLQSRRRAERRAPHHHRRHLRLHPVRSRPGGRRPRQSAAAEDHRRNRRAVPADPRGIAVQFRYAFVVDREGLKVLDVTNLAQPKPVPGAAGSAAKTPAISTSPAPTPTSPPASRAWPSSTSNAPSSLTLDQMFNAGGTLNDAQRREARHGQLQPVRLRRRRQERPARRAAHLAGRQPGLQRLQSATDAEADRHIPHSRPGAGHLQRASIAIAPSMRAATSSRSSDAAARVPSTVRRWNACISKMAGYLP